jgi:hypothetical protein
MDEFSDSRSIERRGLDKAAANFSFSIVAC